MKPITEDDPTNAKHKSKTKINKMKRNKLCLPTQLLIHVQ